MFSSITLSSRVMFRLWEVQTIQYWVKYKKKLKASVLFYFFFFQKSSFFLSLYGNQVFHGINSSGQVLESNSREIIVALKQDRITKFDTFN